MDDDNRAAEGAATPLRVLVAEDSPQDAEIAVREIRRGGFDVTWQRVDTAATMRRAIREKTWDIVLSDFQMPHFSGLAAIALLKETGIDVPLIIVSGAIGEETAVDCMRSGAYDYIMKDNLLRLVPAIKRELKEAESRRRRRLAEEREQESAQIIQGIINAIPVRVFWKDKNLAFLGCNAAFARDAGFADPQDIVGKNDFQMGWREQAEIYRRDDRAVIESGCSKLFIEEPQTTPAGDTITLLSSKLPLRNANGEITGVLGTYMDITDRKRAENDLKQSFILLRELLVGSIKAMASVVESRDPYTAGHQKRVAGLAQAIASEMRLSPHQMEGLRMAAAIHDLGKIAVPAEILSKPTRLSKLEYELIKIHPQAAHDILKDIAFPWPIARIILEHHERMDGSGYPRGLRGEAMLLESRIIAVADVVEAMASHRPYRPTLGIGAALEEIERNKGLLYDADVVSACLALFRDKGYCLEENPGA